MDNIQQQGNSEGRKIKKGFKQAGGNQPSNVNSQQTQQYQNKENNYSNKEGNVYVVNSPKVEDEQKHTQEKAKTGKKIGIFCAIVAVICIIAISVFGLVGRHSKPEKFLTVQLDASTEKTSSISMHVGDTLAIIPQFPDFSYIDSVSYSSSDGKIAVVKDGVITAKKAGTAKIIVESRVFGKQSVVISVSE